jgi:small subunit ribosomal protein S11
MLNRFLTQSISLSIPIFQQSLRLLSLTSINYKRTHADIRDGAVREINLRPENQQTPLTIDVDKYYGGTGQVRETDFEQLIGEANNPEVPQVKYEDLPIVHMKCTRNNTIVDVSDCTGQQIFRTSCGVVGFHNAKKGTTTAAQAVGIHMGNNLSRRNMKHVRVVVKGTGPGRLMAVKGLQLAGIDIVTITDNTSIPTLHVGLQRPKKMRRV